MATQVMDDDTHVERPRLRSRRWWRWIAGAIAVVLVTAWLWIGTHPAVSSGPVFWNGPGTRVANDGLGDTRVVIEEHEAKLVLSVSNNGVVPFTIRGPADDGPGDISVRMQFGPTEGGLEPLERGSGQVTLRPGEARAVLLSVQVDRCLVSAGGGVLMIPVTLRVSQLGITTTQELPTHQELSGLYFPGDAFQEVNRPNDCP